MDAKPMPPAEIAARLRNRSVGGYLPSLHAAAADCIDAQDNVGVAQAAEITALRAERDALRARVAGLEGAWQPIETAPRDGTWFLARSETQRRLVHFGDHYDRFPIDGKGGVWTTAPTHWKPICADCIDAQAAEITALRAERADIKAAKWAEKHVDTLNDFVLIGMARDEAEARAEKAEAERDALAARLAVPGEEELGKIIAALLGTAGADVYAQPWAAATAADALTALRARVAGLEGAWHLIEAFSGQDGEVVLTIHRDDLYPVCAFRINGEWLRQTEGPEDEHGSGKWEPLFRAPTHWMPYPALSPSAQEPRDAE